MEENFNAPTPDGGACEKKRGFIPWLDNFWYHYKWHTVIAIFFIVVITVCALQMCQKEQYDAYILYAGGAEIKHTAKEGDIYTDYQAALGSLSKAAEDYDGDGKINLTFKDLFLLTGEQITEAEQLDDKEVNYPLINQNKELFYDLILFSDYYLCFLSEELYNEYKTVDGVEIFSPLSPYINEGTAVSLTADGCAVYLSSTGFSELPIFADMPEGTVVCLRNVSALAGKFDKKDSSKYHSRAEKMIENIINFRAG